MNKYLLQSIVLHIGIILLFALVYKQADQVSCIPDPEVVARDESQKEMPPVVAREGSENQSPPPITSVDQNDIQKQLEEQVRQEIQETLADVATADLKSLNSDAKEQLFELETINEQIVEELDTARDMQQVIDDTRTKSLEHLLFRISELQKKEIDKQIRKSVDKSAQDLERLLKNELEKKLGEDIKRAITGEVKKQRESLKKLAMQSHETKKNGRVNIDRIVKEYQRQIVQNAMEPASRDLKKKIASAQKDVSDAMSSRIAKEVARELKKHALVTSAEDSAATAVDEVMSKFSETCSADTGRILKRTRDTYRIKQNSETGDDSRLDAASAAVQQSISDSASQKKISVLMQQAVKRLRIKNVIGTNQVSRLQSLADLEARIKNMLQRLEEGRESNMADLLPKAPSVVSLQDKGATAELTRNQRTVAMDNTAAYNEFIKDMRDRINPNNYYSEVQQEKRLASVARYHKSTRPAFIYADLQKDWEKDEESENRTLCKPNFRHKAFGVMALQREKITIDGDLTDWGQLDNPLELRFNHNSPKPVESGLKVYMRWSPEGIYVAYHVPKDAKKLVKPPGGAPWEGDSLEFWIDTGNTRERQMKNVLSAHQFVFLPLGARDGAQQRFFEYRRSGKSLRDSTGEFGYSAAKITEDGYSAECFVKRKALRKPNLLPGVYVALNISLNKGTTRSGDQWQWAASKSIKTWDKPDTWGDVLLLGSDAEISFNQVNHTDRALEALVVGEPIGLTIRDRDMNINTRRVDRISAELSVKGGVNSFFVILEETGCNTGVFRGSVDTQHSFLPAQKNSLSLSGGTTLRAEYQDIHTAYGEKNRVISKSLEVGWPVLKITAKGQSR